MKLGKNKLHAKTKELSISCFRDFVSNDKFDCSVMKKQFLEKNILDL